VATGGGLPGEDADQCHQAKAGEDDFPLWISQGNEQQNQLATRGDHLGIAAPQSGDHDLCIVGGDERAVRVDLN